MGSFKWKKKKKKVGSYSPGNLKFNLCSPLILQLKQMKSRQWGTNLLKVTQLVNGNQLNWRKLNNFPKVTELETGGTELQPRRTQTPKLYWALLLYQWTINIILPSTQSAVDKKPYKQKQRVINAIIVSANKCIII